MPDLSERDYWEGKLARELSRFGRLQMGELYDLLGDPPQLSRVPDDWWRKHRDQLAGVLAGVLLEVFLDAAKRLDSKLTVSPPDWAVVEQGGADWVRSYADSLAGSITANTKKALETLLVLWAAHEWTADLLQRKVFALFGATRLANIAITEVTRAVSAAEQFLVRLLRSIANLALVPVFQTAKDERVCILCNPRDGKRITDGLFPPLHPRCRCYVEWTVLQPVQIMGVKP